MPRPAWPRRDPDPARAIPRGAPHARTRPRCPKTGGDRCAACIQRKADQCSFSPISDFSSRSCLAFIFFSGANVAGLAAFGTIVEAVDAKANPVVRLAETAILVALAQRLVLIALRTEGRHRLPFPPCIRLPAAPILGYARPPSKHA